MKILCIGPMWRGSNAGGLFKALGRQGCLIEIVDEFYYLSLLGNRKIERLFYKLIRPFQIKLFNRVILNQASLFNPDIVLVYKGHFVNHATLSKLQERYKIVNFYPDVSFHTHGNFLKKTLPLYELVFTTKTFGVKDMADQLNQKNGYFIPHGYDPEIHRPIEITGKLKKELECDVSFIGTWSPNKELLLTHLVKEIPEIDLKIWGSQWYKAKPFLSRFIQGQPILGDIYAAAICCTKINLGLLSEQVIGASSGDQITSRTYHIPGTGGFMLHQYTSEAIQYFIPNEEAVFFKNEHEMVEKIRHYLYKNEERMSIANAGHFRALKEHSLDDRAKMVLKLINEVMFIC